MIKILSLGARVDAACPGSVMSLGAGLLSHSVTRLSALGGIRQIEGTSIEVYGHRQRELFMGRRFIVGCRTHIV